MRVLITGANGFVGPWLARHILRETPDAAIWGMVWGEEGRDELSRIGPGLQQVVADLTSPQTLPPVLEHVRPELVFHLAAASSVAASWSTPGAFLKINAVGQVHLFEALLAAGMAPTVVVASSAEVYGAAAGAEPAREELPMRPLSPYGVSKAAQELIALQYHLSHGLPTVRLRSFNLVGPGQTDRFAPSAFSRQIAEVEAGVRQAVSVGNLAARRDFTDVRDAVRAYWLAATRCRPGEVYNLSSGTPVSIGELLEVLLSLSAASIPVEEDPERMRPADILIQHGDFSRLESACGWRPKIPLRQTLQDLLEWWRQRLQAGDP